MLHKVSFRSPKETVPSFATPLPAGGDELDDLDVLAEEAAPSQPSHQVPEVAMLCSTPQSARELTAGRVARRLGRQQVREECCDMLKHPIVTKVRAGSHTRRRQTKEWALYCCHVSARTHPLQTPSLLASVLTRNLAQRQVITDTWDTYACSGDGWDMEDFDFDEFDKEAVRFSVVGLMRTPGNLNSPFRTSRGSL